MKPTYDILLIALFFSCHRLPSSIEHSITDDKHIYKISKLHWTSKPDSFRYEAEVARSVTGCVQSTIDRDKDQLILVCENELVDLETEMNKLMGWGLFPGWDELVTRDKRSPDYDPSLYTIALETTLTPHNNRGIVKHEIYPNGDVGLFMHELFFTTYEDSFELSEYRLKYSDEGYELDDVPIMHTIDKESANGLFDVDNALFDTISINYRESQVGYLRFNEYTEYCMCAKWYSMRLFTEDGEYIWEDPFSLCGGIQVIPYDFDNDGIEELIVFSCAHQYRRILVYDN